VQQQQREFWLKQRLLFQSRHPKFATHRSRGAAIFHLAGELIRHQLSAALLRGVCVIGINFPANAHGAGQISLHL
jgi:hypothetical protein